MVAGAAVTFPAVGYLSDRIGRRRVVVPALLLAIAAAVVMPAWPSLAGLIAGRLLAGAAVGLMASTATAYIADLHRAAHSGRPGRPGSPGPGRISATANLGGLALGPLAAGALAAWVSFPLGTPYAVFAASAVAQLAPGRLPAPGQLAAGAVLFPAGLALTALSVYQPASAAIGTRHES